MSRITESARNEDCLIRSPICNFDIETTVFAHLNGAGMGRKYVFHDIHGKPIDIGSYACSDCHNLVDRRDHFGQSWAADTVSLWHLDGTILTIGKLIEKGLLIAG